MLNVAIIQFPGTNCEKETHTALQRCGLNPFSFFWNDDHKVLHNADGYVIAGGFSYEDRSRSGIIAALDPVLKVLQGESEKGKPVIGICNGAQILVEVGLVPGLPGYPVAMALAPNKRLRGGKIIGTGYYNAWINLQVNKSEAKHNQACGKQEHNQNRETCAFLQTLNHGALLKVPIAHAEGRFVIPKTLLVEMKKRGMIPFRYCSSDGIAVEQFPENPNGSVWNAAGVCNEPGNVLALMPHPERSPAGDPIFHSMRMYMESKKRFEHNEEIEFRTSPLSLSDYTDHLAFTKHFELTHSGLTHSGRSSPAYPASYTTPENCETLIVGMIITDNEAVTVENTLNRLGIEVRISRKTYWEIHVKGRDELDEGDNKVNTSKKGPHKQLNKNKEHKGPDILHAIEKSGELYNSNKEYIAPFKAPAGSRTLLIREKEDMIGMRMKEILSSWYGISEIESIVRGVLWTITPGPPEIVYEVLETNILHNPFSQEVWIYT